MALTVQAQENEYSFVVDTTKAGGEIYIPTGIRIGVDLLGPVLYAFDNRTLSYELTTEVDFDRFFIVGEAGYQNFQEQNENVNYKMSGNFFRVGPEANFLHRDNQLNSFSFGIRYSWASFNEKIVGDVNEPNWGAVPVNFDISNKSWWVEMTTGVKVRLFKGFFAGYVLRFRFLRSSTIPDVPFEPYYVPGYGLADRANTWGFRYYILYRIQWSKKGIRPKSAN